MFDAACVFRCGVYFYTFTLKPSRDLLLRACVGVGTLAANGKLLNMPRSSVASDVHQTLHVRSRLRTQHVADDVVVLDGSEQLREVELRQLAGGGRRRGADVVAQGLCAVLADPIDALQGHPQLLLRRQVHAEQTLRHPIEYLEREDVGNKEKRKW